MIPGCYCSKKGNLQESSVKVIMFTEPQNKVTIGKKKKGILEG